MKKKTIIITFSIVVLIPLITGYLILGLTRASLSKNSITFEEVTQLLDLHKKELETRLEGHYKVIKNSEEHYLRYECNNLGITVVVCFSNDVMWIECNNMIDINGAKAGMTFSEIHKKLGKSEIVETWLESPEQPAYEISYKFNNCRVYFQSIKKDGQDSTVLIVKELPLGKIKFPYVRITPVDEADNNPDFKKFRNRLITAIGKKDVQFLLEHIDQDIQFSFGAVSGYKHFVEYWKLKTDPSNSEIWNELMEVLTLGGRFNKDGSFTAPYTFTDFFGERYDELIVINNNVNIYNKPNLKSKIVGKVGFEIVRTGDFYSLRTRGKQFINWHSIITSSGVKGFVYGGEILRSPIDYRAVFQMKNDKWVMVSFIAGD